MEQNRVVGLLKAIFYLGKRRNEFSLRQAAYLFHELAGNKEKAKELRLDTLKSYIGLKENSRYYILDDLLFVKPSGNLTEALIGMCLDIFLEDSFYNFTDKSIRQNIQEELQFYFYHEDPYEIQEVQVCENDMVIDAGANMGLFSILSAKKGAKVYSFEPQALFYDLLNENCKINFLEEKIQTYPLAVSSHECKASLSVNQSNLLAASINIDRNGGFEAVSCTSVDTWVKANQIPRIDFIKADIEGAERLLLKGAENTIKEFRPKIALATYHLPDDKEVLRKGILEICPEYKLIQTGAILFAY